MSRAILSFTVLSTMLFTSLVFAQDKKRYDVFLAAGIESPISPDRFNDTYKKVGFNGQVGADYFLTNRIAVGGNLAYNRLILDKDFLRSEIGLANANVSGGNLSVWEFDGIGKYYFLPSARATNLYFVGGPGLAVAKISKLKVTPSGGTTTTTTFDNETDFMLTGGIGVTRQLNSRWSVFAEGRYSYIFAKNSSQDFANGKNPSYLPVRIGVIF
ncbi:MAG TPA: outer membrane beta-barrel protein [bacterium]